MHVGEEHLKRSKEEFEILKKLRHPNIINCVDCFCDEASNQMVIVLEFCDCKFC